MSACRGVIGRASARRRVYRRTSMINGQRQRVHGSPLRLAQRIRFSSHSRSCSAFSHERRSSAGISTCAPWDQSPVRGRRDPIFLLGANSISRPPTSFVSTCSRPSPSDPPHARWMVGQSLMWGQSGGNGWIMSQWTWYLVAQSFVHHCPNSRGKIRASAKLYCTSVWKLPGEKADECRPLPGTE
jgi:hypothetical protein